MNASPARIASAVALAVALVVTSTPRVASASVIFPPEVQSHLGLKTTPACTLCHQTLSGGIGTATKPFGASIRGHGGVAGSTSSIDGALDAMDKDGTDSDGDCVGDIAELKAGTDPDNAADNPTACGDGGARDGGSSSGAPASPLTPEYGCAAARGTSDHGPAPFAALAVLGAWMILRRRGKRARGS